jgi:hypothetical protein
MRTGLFASCLALLNVGCPIGACSAVVGAIIGSASDDVDPPPARVVLAQARDAVNHPAASTMKVGGHAQLDHAVRHAAAGADDAHGWTHVVPVVDEDWSEGEPVAVWIAAPYQTRRVAAWEQALGAALEGDGIEATVVARVHLAPEQGRHTRWEQAIAAVPAGDGPTAADAAVVLLWPAVDVTPP